MSKLDDLELDRSGDVQADRRRPRLDLWAAGIVLAIVVGGLIFYLTLPGTEPVTSTTAPAPPQEEAGQPATDTDVAPAPVDPALPALSASDQFVRELARLLSSNPAFAEWLATDDLIRRFVVSVENIAEGANPARHVRFLQPDARLATTAAAGGMRIDPASYDRYDTLASVVASLDAAGTAELVRRLMPLMNEAYRELGHPDGGFERTLGRAIDRLLDVSAPAEAPAVFGTAGYYLYENPALEELPPVEKQFLAMGPDNVARVQAKLREIRRALEAEGVMPR